MDQNGEKIDYEEKVDLNGEKIDEITHNQEVFDEVVDPNKLARFVMPKRNDSEYLDIKKVLW